MEAVSQTMEAVQELPPTSNAHVESADKAGERLLPLPVGTVLLDRFMLTAIIGKGGTSYIYRARDLLAVLGRDEKESQLAVKVVAALDDDKIERQLILREALATRHLAHPNIIKIYDYHRDGQLCFVTMELIEGESLAASLQRAPQRKIPYRRALPILLSVAKALDAAHKQGIIHTDVKPSNILLTNGGEVKVIDFATARSYRGAVASGRQPQGHSKNKNQRVESLRGDSTDLFEPAYYGYTPAYASPQALSDKPAQPSDDVFSFACIVYEVLTGRHPYNRQSSLSALQSKLRPLRPREISVWQWRVLKAALSFESERRFTSVAVFFKTFNLARHVTSYLLLACALGVGFLALLGPINDTVTSFWQQKNQRDLTVQQQQDANNVVSAVASLPVNSRIAYLDGIESLPRLLRSGVLAEVRPFVLDPVINEVNGAMNYNESLPNFSELSAKIDAAMAIYPDSSALMQAQTKLQAERDQLATALTIRARKIWSSEGLSVADAQALQTINAQLKQLGLPQVDPGSEVVNLYSGQVMAALAESSFLEIADKYDVAQILAHPSFSAVWTEVDKDLLNTAVALKQYIGLGRKSAYPDAVLEKYVTPALTTLRGEIDAAWLDKDILPIVAKLDQLAEQFYLNDSVESFLQIKTALLGKLEAKLKYHRDQGNRNSFARMQEVANELRLRE